jgi:alpha-D-ribose 1-methylphosphonate 5-phosphate C-P lyase
MELGDLSLLGLTPGQCTAYHRDRKEPWGVVEPRDINTSELDAVAKDYGVDYVYIYNDEYEWECSRLDYASGELAPVTILAAVA